MLGGSDGGGGCIVDNGVAASLLTDGRRRNAVWGAATSATPHAIAIKQPRRHFPHRHEHPQRHLQPNTRHIGAAQINKTHA
jgi:hypothetical protein